MEFEVGSCFDTYEEFELAFNKFCLENKFNFVKTDCKTMESYFRRYGSQFSYLAPLRFSRLVYSCSTRGFSHLKNSGRIHVCTAGVRAALDKRLRKLKVKRIDKIHSSTCFHMQEQLIDEAKKKQRGILKQLSAAQIIPDIKNFDNISNTSDSEMGSTSINMDKRAFALKRKAEILDVSSNTQDSTDSESDWDGEKYNSFQDTQPDKQVIPSMQIFDDLPTMQNLSKIRPTSFPRQQLPQQQQNVKVKIRKLEDPNNESSNFHENSPVNTTNTPSNTKKILIKSSSNTADVINVTSQVFDWADTFFVSSICAEMNTLPKRVKNNLKLRIFQMVNKTVEEYAENDGCNTQNEQAASDRSSTSEDITIQKISSSQNKMHASSSRNFPSGIRTKFQNGTRKLMNCQNGGVPPVVKNTNSPQIENYQSFTNITSDTNFSNRNDIYPQKGNMELQNGTFLSFGNTNRQSVGDVAVDGENRASPDLDQLLEEVSESQSIPMKEETDWDES